MIDNILITEKSVDYELLDSGEGEKLERYGKVVLSRPDPQAIWSKSLPESEWKKADAVFSRVGTTGKWEVVASSKHLASKGGFWNIQLDNLTFQLQLLPSKHIGVFSEQSEQWKWLEEKIVSRISPERSEGNKTYKAQATTVLNLFGYTGGASLACARAGAEVCHVDSSEFAVDLAHTNMKLSGLSDKKIRFIVDDVRKFVEREIKRKKKYDVIILDPPIYGKGTKKEVWKVEDDLLPFLLHLKNIISDNPLAIVLNGYASNYSSITYVQLLETLKLKGKITHGELAIKESSAGRLLPCGIFARWEQ
ncbi:MAG: class I SAM-dependent methyltransferase [Candidatus Paceibacterota bacterium]|jgi:23S rRNA (cytosine1962-C5)-methyltransferase